MFRLIVLACPHVSRLFACERVSIVSTEQPVSVLDCGPSRGGDREGCSSVETCRDQDMRHVAILPYVQFCLGTTTLHYKISSPLFSISRHMFDVNIFGNKINVNTCNDTKWKINRNFCPRSLKTWRRGKMSEIIYLVPFSIYTKGSFNISSLPH